MPQAKELHFKRMRRTERGRRQILEVLRNPAIASETVKVVRYHKSFMVTTKIVDMLVETLIHSLGRNLYERGANLGLANMWHAVMPAFCGPDLFARLQATFVAMVRTPSDDTVAAFYETIERMMEASTNSDFLSDLRLLLATHSILDGDLLDGDVTSMDPAIPAFFELATVWTTQLSDPFVILHDPSHPMIHQREALELMMSTTEPTTTIGFDRRTTSFPIRASALRLETASEESPLLQVADIIAGAASHVFSTVARGQKDDFADAILETRFGEVEVRGVWPTLKVTPEELGTEASGGIDPIEHVTQYTARQRRARGKR